MPAADVSPTIVAATVAQAIRGRVTQIHGDRDASVLVAFGQMTASMTPHCRFVIYKGAPHGLIVTHKERLNTDILNFIRS
jgi:pimeloyl-ACP methyl ester carboxylesterase